MIVGLRTYKPGTIPAFMAVDRVSRWFTRRHPAADSKPRRPPLAHKRPEADNRRPTNKRRPHRAAALPQPHPTSLHGAGPAT